MRFAANRWLGTMLLACVGCADAKPGSPASGGSSGMDAGNDATADVDAAPCLPPVSGSSCDTFPACGCGATQRCVVVSAEGATACVGLGSEQPYQACQPLQCGGGYQCVAGVCKQFCDKSSDCTTGGQCVPMRDSATGEVIVGHSICTANCALHDAAGVCGPGVNCTFNAGGFTTCVVSGSGTTEGSCPSLDATECAPGFGCFGAGNCRRWCRTNYGDCDTANTGQVCIGTNPPTDIGGEPYGYCFK